MTFLDEIINISKFKITLNQDISGFDGIIFVFPFWSIEFIHLKKLIEYININYINVIVNIIDIDIELCREFECLYNVINHGFGETYLIKDGQIIKSILKYRGDLASVIKTFFQ